jgi:hypothetical protein
LLNDPLPSNGRPIVSRVGFRGNVFIELLLGSESVRHNTVDKCRDYLRHVAANAEDGKLHIAAHLARTVIRNPI